MGIYVIGSIHSHLQQASKVCRNGMVFPDKSGEFEKSTFNYRFLWHYLTGYRKRAGSPHPLSIGTFLMTVLVVQIRSLRALRF
jgi:hypothetical protein